MAGVGVIARTARLSMNLQQLPPPCYRGTVGVCRGCVRPSRQACARSVTNSAGEFPGPMGGGIDMRGGCMSKLSGNGVILAACLSVDQV